MISIVLGIFINILAAANLFALIYPLSTLVQLALLALWLWVMVRAFIGQKVSLPIIGPIAERCESLSTV